MSASVKWDSASNDIWDSSSDESEISVATGAKFSEMLQSEMNLTSSQVFNMAVTTLNAKLLPIISINPGRGGWGMTNQDRVTVMTCSNLDATLKLRLLVIGKSAQPRGLKNVQRLAIPVCYAHQENSIINSQIFAYWFANEFVPTVSRFLTVQGFPSKAVLLIDDIDPQLPDLAVGDVRTMPVPPGANLKVATMKHTVTADLKRRYRLGLLESSSDAKDKGHDPIRYVKNLGMKDIIFRLDAAWTEVTQQTIVDSWCNLLPLVTPLESDPLALEEPPGENVILRLLREVSGKDEITEELAEAWIKDEETFPKGHCMKEIALMETGNAADQRRTRIRETNDISPLEAVEALDSVICFFEHHGQLSTKELVALRKARDSAYEEHMRTNEGNEPNSLAFL